MESDLRAICLLGLGFMFIFSAFNSQGFIEIAILRDKKSADTGITKDSGFYSFAIIYASFTVSNFLASPIVVTLGSKNAMILGGSCYLLFLLGIPMDKGMVTLSSFGGGRIWSCCDMDWERSVPDRLCSTGYQCTEHRNYVGHASVVLDLWITLYVHHSSSWTHS
ncbi:hypothetical protein L596_004207 [Steinernema carpocapsae]|uniref:Uncharacterized protein n=1 Tax=Steinernema carpocapsae TaxID=34508 RepID=A0A4U8UV30_STECR|nr:hypothetical protein L596_004207 [Steinernema carpocapsae]